MMRETLQMEAAAGRRTSAVATLLLTVMALAAPALAQVVVRRAPPHQGTRLRRQTSHDLPRQQPKKAAIVSAAPLVLAQPLWCGAASSFDSDGLPADRPVTWQAG
jgi:hypothetical protein